MKIKDLTTIQLDDFYSFYVGYAMEKSMSFAASSKGDFQMNHVGNKFYGNEIDNKYQPYLIKAKKKLEQKYNIKNLEWDTKN
ncbi:hypothetical protein [Fructilactobacillus sanfranciscensis]|uniref:hypothetical protein n=1 Tax=Fructilactobacillus sanfranciscensis TaxID=1625 RepID=UPI0011AEDB43|nr:hypothetical protein [Fructilactobacillus sanfranciscensis]MCG7194748.1 hypothetical protein [Fructilactobacillus sanfranciscensis]MVF15230.1 hypothetical protein [Fructilactobacillus sanfranciscensis]NDR76674.1 hypothetical protein [Fructilactobacillus sanfranciscensis]